MKRNRVVFWIMEFICGALVLICAVAMLAGDKLEHNMRIYALLQNSDSSEKNSFISGMHSAAEEKDVELIIIDSGGIATPEEQKNIILREAQSVADAFIVEPLPGEESGKNMSEIIEVSPTIFVETDIYDNPGAMVIQSDNKALGEALANEIIRHYKNRGNMNISTVCSNRNVLNVIERFDAFSESLKAEGLTCGDMIEAGSTESELAISAIDDADIVVAFDNSSLVAIGNYFTDIDGPELIGIGNSTEAIYLLDKGTIECMIVPDEYRLGYNSVLSAVSKIKRSTKKDVLTDVGYFVINKENLYSPESEKVLYALSR